MSDPIELAIWKEIASLHMSVSHDRWHIERVLRFAYALQAIHGGDREVLTAAVLMHDLGRGDETRLHGTESIDSSTEQANTILRSINYPEDKSQNVLKAIAEHDQPQVTPSTIEGRILKDADFLAGFGAWGILRIAMWSGETSRNISLVLDRLENGMLRRLDSLEFPESAQWARKEMLFSRLFLEQLKGSPPTFERSGLGRYIVLEGISGSGKDTQASLLAEKLRDRGIGASSFGEPHQSWREYRNSWRGLQGEADDPPNSVKRWLMIAARESLMAESVGPALARGDIVLSVRSFVSTMVYQCASDQEAAQVGFAHYQMPQPDLVLLLDLPVETAWERITSREKEAGIYETLDQLPHHRNKYRQICERYFGSRLRVIDASASASDVAEAVWQAVEPIIPVA